jgi:hypothetical protein
MLINSDELASPDVFNPLPILTFFKESGKGFAIALRLLLSVAITLLSIGAQARLVNLLGRPIELVIPSGYCEFGGHPADSELVSRAREGIGTSNQILALFADCKELDDFRKGNRPMLDNHGQILAQNQKGQLRAFKGVSRPEYIKNMSAQAGYLPDALKKADARLKQFPWYQNNENLGLLATDSNGLYVGLLMTVTDATGRPRAIVGVVGFTLVKEISITINLHQVYRSTPDLRGLLARQQTAMASFVRANN